MEFLTSFVAGISLGDIFLWAFVLLVVFLLSKLFLFLFAWRNVVFLLWGFFKKMKSGTTENDQNTVKKMDHKNVIDVTPR